MHPLRGGLPFRMCLRVLLVMHWLLIGTRLRLLAAELHSNAGPLCLSQVSVSLWTILMTPVFDGKGEAGFKSRANAFLFP